MIQLQFETLNICNARCKFCPYPTMKRPKRRMSAALFERIAGMAEHTALPIVAVSFQGLGEPTLDPAIVERIRRIRRINSTWDLSMYTNGFGLTVEKVKALKEAGLNMLAVSINSVSHAQRQELMGLNDYGKLVPVVREAMKEGIVIPKAVGDYLTEEEMLRFRIMYYDMVSLNSFVNWAGRMFPTEPTATGCPRALHQYMILSDGRVSLCCMDAEGEVTFGDLNHQTLDEVYANPEWVRYREAHARGDKRGLRLCETCTEA